MCSHLWQPFCTGFSGERLHMEVARRAPAGWAAASLAPEKVKWYSLHSAPSEEADVKQPCRGLRWPGLQRSCRWRCREGPLGSLGRRLLGSSYSPFFAHRSKFWLKGSFSTTGLVHWHSEQNLEPVPACRTSIPADLGQAIGADRLLF